MAWSGTLSANALKAAVLQRFGLRFCFVRLRFCTDKKVIALTRIRYGNLDPSHAILGLFTRIASASAMVVTTTDCLLVPCDAQLLYQNQ